MAPAGFPVISLDRARTRSADPSFRSSWLCVKLIAQVSFLLGGGVRHVLTAGEVRIPAEGGLRTAALLFITSETADIEPLESPRGLAAGEVEINEHGMQREVVVIRDRRRNVVLELELFSRFPPVGAETLPRHGAAPADGKHRQKQDHRHQDDGAIRNHSHHRFLPGFAIE